MGNERKPPPSEDQKTEQVKSLCRALNRICDAWTEAIEAEDARGRASESPGPRAVAGEVKLDDRDPLHVRQMPPAKGKPSAFGDSTGNRAIRGDVAGPWLDEARNCLLILLYASGAEAPGERRWAGKFHPPSLRGTLCLAARDVVSMWPTNIARLIERIHVLANTASREWPPTPKPGQTIETPDGPVTVGAPAKALEVCVECGTIIGANAADPLARIDGKPYHRTPCYNTVYVRTKRRRSAVNSDPKRQQPT